MDVQRVYSRFATFRDKTSETCSREVHMLTCCDLVVTAYWVLECQSMGIVWPVAQDTIHHPPLTEVYRQPSSDVCLLEDFIAFTMRKGFSPLSTTLHSGQRRRASFRVMVVGGEAQRFKRPFEEEQGLVKGVYFKGERLVFP